VAQVDRGIQRHMHSKADCYGLATRTERLCCRHRPAPRRSHECRCHNLSVERSNHGEGHGDGFQIPDDGWKTSEHRSSVSLLAEHHQHLQYTDLLPLCTWMVFAMLRFI